MIEIIATGPGLTVQDLGRRGLAAWGIGSGGAADRGSLRLANRLVGNHEGAAAFELLLGGAELRLGASALVAVTGAAVGFTVDGREAGAYGPVHVQAGGTLRFATPATGVRTYVAVRGGLATEVLLGSRSIDERSGIGRALRRGDEIAVGQDSAGLPNVDVAPRRRPDSPVVLRGVLGPRDDWFTDAALHTLATSVYTVSGASDRIGVRLDGPALTRRCDAELLSEATIRGAVEVPADGLPIVFGSAHPTTCGYPVVAVLDDDSADRLAQCRPGEPVTFALTRPPVLLRGDRA